MTFLDTNILIYAVDTRDSRKQQIAKSIVMSARNTVEYAISAQVLNEFSNVAMNKLRKTREETRDFVELFMSMVRKYDILFLVRRMKGRTNAL